MPFKIHVFLIVKTRFSSGLIKPAAVKLWNLKLLYDRTNRNARYETERNTLQSAVPSGSASVSHIQKQGRVDFSFLRLIPDFLIDVTENYLILAKYTGNFEESN
jgi:hypothetical protein